MRMYIATKSQEVARAMRDAINRLGHTCTASWLDATGYGSLGNDDFQRREAAITDYREIAASDALILIAEPDGAMVRGGKHVETGMAIALGKPVYVIGNRENIFHWHPLVSVFASADEFTRTIGGAAENECDNCGAAMDCPPDGASGIKLCSRCKVGGAA